jgi:hypothetical protein
MADKVILNEKEVTKDQSEEAKTKAEATPGLKIVEKEPGVFKQRIQG